MNLGEAIASPPHHVLGPWKYNGRLDELSGNYNNLWLFRKAISLQLIHCCLKKIIFDYDIYYVICRRKKLHIITD